MSLIYHKEDHMERVKEGQGTGTNDPQYLTEHISVGEDLSCLSAILMDNDYYSFTIEHSMNIDEIHIASPEALICLKAKAYVEMLVRKRGGEQVDSRDIEKHIEISHKFG